MTEYVTTADALFFHRQLIEQYGGAAEVRDVGALESALHRPQTGYYDSIIHEAAALLESLIQNHPFVDGNKRVGHAAVETFLLLNGHELSASVGDAEGMVLRLAGGQCARSEFEAWIADHLRVTE